MNERIRELAEEATAYADTLDVADQKIYQKIRDREFAELIVKECALTAGLMEHEGRPNIGAQILDNFGVES
jgi:hypothetical protein